MNKIKLPTGEKPKTEIFGAVRISKDHKIKYRELQFNKGNPIKNRKLLECMIDYFYEELIGEINE
jgi:hypothetical protein